MQLDVGMHARILVGSIAVVACGSAPATVPLEPRATPAAVAAPTPAVPTAVLAAPPVATPVEPEPSAPRWGHADLDPANDGTIGPPPALPDCEQRLRDAGVTWKTARIGTSRKQDGVPTCGAEQVVRFKRGPGAITYSSAPLLTCQMALALADFERVVQEQAERELGSRVARIEHLGTFNCREMANYDLISEHSYANGLDIRRLTLADGRVVDVLKDFRPREAEATDPRTTFLRTLANRLYDEELFSVVVTPFFDAAHRNHIHVDLARYRVDGSRP